MIEASRLRTSDLPALAALWTQALAREEDDCPLTVPEIEDHVLLHGGEPRAILAIDPQGWIAARSDGALLGFVHCTVGRLQADDPEILRGFLRTLALAPDAPQAAIRVLLRAADAYFRSKHNLTNIFAFHLHTGYPRLNYGRGTAGHEQWALMDALGEENYRLSQRWLFYNRDFTDLIPEHQPQLPGLKLQWEEQVDERFTLSAWSGLDAVARARFMIFPQPPECSVPRVASLYHLEVLPDYQHQGIGRWLLERGANHLIARGVHRLLEDASHEDARTQSRLLRLGFHEDPQRGYVYEKPHA